MRTIKFRGKKLHNREWACGYLTDVDNTPIGKVGIINSKPFSGYEESTMVIAETIGQFTNAYDRNDEEVYEGDIIKVYNKKYDPIGKGVVTWNAEWGYYALEGTGSTIEYGLYFNMHNNIIEIVGNIYDNPELMKGGLQ